MRARNAAGGSAAFSSLVLTRSGESCGRFVRPLLLMAGNVGHFQRVSAVPEEGKEMVANAAGVSPSVAGVVFGVQREFAAGAVSVPAVLTTNEHE